MTQQSLNKIGNYSKPKRSVRDTSKPTVKAEATITATPKDAVAPHILYRPLPMYFTVEGIFLDEGVPKIEKSGDIVGILMMATIVIAHTSRLQYSFTALKRKYGKSVFKIKTSLGLSFQGELSTALRWVKKLLKPMLGSIQSLASANPQPYATLYLQRVTTGCTEGGEDGC